MNRIYRLVWSEIRSAWVAAPETTKGHRKGAGRTKLAASLALALTAAPALADDVNWADVYPTYNFPVLANYDAPRETGFAFTIDGDTGTATHYAAGTTLNILGPIPTITAGTNGNATQLLVRNGLIDSTGADADPGRITMIQATDSNNNNLVTPITSANIDTFSYSTNEATPQQNQELNVVVPGLDGSYAVIKVYDSSTFSAPGTSLVGDLPLNVYDANSFHIYNNFGIASVAAVGGTANINVGADTNGTTPISAAANTIDLLAKNSTLAKADGSGTAASAVKWQSDNYVHFAPAAVISGDLQKETAVSSQYNDSITLPNYVLDRGQVVQAGSRTFTINSAADIATVNNFLLGTSRENSQVQLWLTGGVTLPPENGGAVIDSPVIAQNTYNAIIQSLLSAEQQNRVDLTYHVWDNMLAHNNNATLGTGSLNVIYATGANATGTVTSTGSLAVDGATAVMRGDNGAVLTNDGNINIWRSSGSSPAGVGMMATDATATNTNNSTINAGLFLEKDGTNQNVSNQGTIAMQGLGASQLSNLGFINVALTDGTTDGATGIQAQGTTAATNSGTVAVTGNTHNTDGRASGYGADISGAATFINTAGGNIYVGTTPITATTPAAPTSMIGGAVQSAAIRTSSTGAVTNNGTITLGAQTRNAVGILVNGGTGAVLNTGTINVLGVLGVNGAAAQNDGLSAIDTSNVTNTGAIRVFGDNNVAINLLARTAAASVNSTIDGAITVGADGDRGGSDNNPFTYRNYAVYAEGLNGFQATADVDSSINLLSAGAIGAHARGSATINVGANAVLNFGNTNQIGYYAYGEAAKINLGSATIDDNDQAGSILFAIDHGAQFDGSSGGAGPYVLTVTGTGSTGVFANGLDTGADGQPGGGDDSLTTLNTGLATIHVGGENAVGVKITGGATGTINNGGILLEHNDATAVVVDGRNYTIEGTKGAGADALATNVLSKADIGTTASQSGIKGYDISWLGKIDIESDGTSLAGSNNIGIYLHDGGIANNNAPIDVSGTNNIGVYIQDKGTLSNLRDITVTGAAGSNNVGVKVQGAGAQVTQLGNVTANGGLAAVQLVNDGASLAISGTNNHITASNGADGILMDLGSASLTASNTQIDISGSGAGINNKADTSNINLTDVTINAADGPAIRTAVTFDAEGSGNQLIVSGSGAGFAFEQADGSNTTGNLTIGTGYTIDVTGVTGANGNGILAKTDGSVTSGADITMVATGGAAISAVDASAVTNNGNIQTSSNTNTSILATNAGAFTNNGTINATGAINPLALIRINGTAANRTILNTGKITDASPYSVVIDASGTASNSVTNQGTLSAASNTATALLTGSGNDSVTLSGAQATTGLINLGSGTDTFTWDSGTLDGAVDFTGADGNDSANIGDVDLTSTRHILSEGGSNSTLTFTNTHALTDPALIGSLTADDVATATNIGTGWSTLAVTGTSADVRVVDNLQLSGTPLIQVTGGGTLRSGDNVIDPQFASIRNYNVSTDGADSLLVFDGLFATQTYSGIISGTGGLERAGGGTTILTGENTYTGNTLIDNGGTLQLGDGGAPGALSAQTNITDNGVLNINQSDTVNLGGAISGTGAFYQTGSGTTRLSGTNTYQGVTQVNGGTLLVNGDQRDASGDTTVASGATLGGYGTIGGDVLFNSGTVLRPGDESHQSGVGTLTVNGNMTLAGDTDSQFQLGEVYQPGGALNDLVHVKGNLALDGDLNVTLSPDGAFLPGVYRLFNYDGQLTDNTLNIVSLPPYDSGAKYSVQTAVANQVNLILNYVDPASVLQFWDGDDTGEHDNEQVNGGDGTWRSTRNTPTNNWTVSTGEGNAPWDETAFAIFQGQKGIVTLNDDQGRVITSGMQFLTDGYVVQQLNDHSQLHFISTVTDAFPQAVPVPQNNWATEGETRADSFFIIRVGSGNAGDSDADITTTINADLVQDELDAGVVRLLKTDPGRLILNGDNVISGGIEVWNGTLQASKDSSLGNAGTSLTLRNGATFQAGDDFTTNRLVFLDGAAGGTFDTYGHTFTPTGVIGGDGSLAVVDSSDSGDGILELNTANTYKGDTTITGKNGTGTLTVNANTTGAFGKQDSTVSLTDEAVVNFNNDASAQSHTFDVNNSTLAFNNGATAESSTIGLTGGIASFTGSSNAGSAKINVDADSQMLMSDSAHGGTSVTTNSGMVAFSGNAQAANATIANQSGANVTLADASNKTSIGSLSGEGTVNLGSKTLSEGNLNLNDTISGLISGVGGGLEKVGTGILTLTADNTFTGATSVMNGVLLINGDQSAATGATSVASNATLGGEGILGANVSVADNGHLAPGKDLSSVGILTMNNLTLANNAQLDFQFGKSNVQDEQDPLNDLLVVNGDLTLDGKLNIAQTPGGKFDVGVYRVINYSGNLINNGLQFGTVPDAASQLYVQTSVANQVNLVNTSGLVLNFWDGTGGPNGGLKNNGKIDGGDGVWQNSGGNDNWSTDQTDPDGAINAPFSDGAFAVFSGRKGNVTVDNSLGDVLISGAQFTTNGYVINDGVITTNTADTVIRVGDGTALGRLYTATINSQITGSGGIDKTDVGTLVLNGNNSYRGGTTVSGGVLQVSGDQNLGAADTGITLNGGTFRYGAAFDTARAWTVGDNSGTIDTNGNDVSLLSAVSGSGGLTKAGDGTLTLTKDSSYSGLTTIRNGTLQLGSGGGTGSVAGNILNLDTLVVNRNNTVDLDGVITGTGDFIQRGSGTTYLNGLNNWSGYTLVENGTLIAGGISRFSANSTHIVSQNATLDTGGRNQTVANLVNQGTVNLRGGNVGSTLTVNGDYVGMDGTIKIAAQQHSPGVADKLVINGGTATGTTRLDIDVSQLGEPTTGDGIMVVEAKNGATTTAQTTKDAFNIGGDKLIAGAWQYQLYAGNASGAGEDWFLRAGYSPVVPGFDTLPSIVRQADLFVLGTLHQRVGDEQPWRADVPEDQEGRFWARYLTKTVDQHLDDATSSKSHSQYDGMQIGFDLWQNDKWRSGIYTTFMDLDSSVSGNTGMGGGSAYNSTFSSYVGGYATWTDTNGFYVDNVLQYGYHSVDLKSEGSSDTYHPNGNTVTASVEVGKPWQLGDSNWAFEPQAQLVWQWSNFDDVTLNDGVDTHVSTDADSAVIGRLGARLTADYDTNMGKVKPYVRVNFWKELTDGDDAVTYSNGANSHGKTTLKANQQFSATEAAVGATWTVTNDVQAYTEVGKTWDNGDDTNVDADLSASVGMKIRF
ncbi:autotransporter-associated beta strand repeat-containing protein [Scandinavium sp. H11S7]|uniref:Autotransporter-associated beta strand repeat-containing protein n=1 Tax=Scandinavium hiltneri TaxID=2926519 RepID=A0ABT2E6X3_9ENTR|nr:autotransporter-associated beta strand repeat-containing protein [Scandinavium hiltneri]MCS2163624.1 autotransporter-associated beta strand repeat-containing protein [Scandinavium hiltneri]